MRTKSRNQLSLFDAPPRKIFQEVSQDTFLSWPPRMQFAYCARRDEDSFQLTGDVFFQNRAKEYWNEVTKN